MGVCVCVLWCGCFSVSVWRGGCVYVLVGVCGVCRCGWVGAGCVYVCMCVEGCMWCVGV